MLDHRCKYPSQRPRASARRGRVSAVRRRCGAPLHRSGCGSIDRRAGRGGGGGRRLPPGLASIHRGTGGRSRTSTATYEQARQTILVFAGREVSDDVAIICRNTIEAINHLAFRLDLGPDDVVVTTVVEHHANLLPWRRYAKVRYVECNPEGTFEPDAVAGALRGNPHPKLFAVTGASNVSGWLPPVGGLIKLSHEAGVPVLVDAAHLAPHRPLLAAADYLAWSGHKMYAPFGAAALVGPRRTFAMGDPFLAAAGRSTWCRSTRCSGTLPQSARRPDRPTSSERWPSAPLPVPSQPSGGRRSAHNEHLASRLRSGLGAIEGSRVLGPGPLVPTLPVASFVVEDVHHALVAARLAAEWGISVRHGRMLLRPPLPASLPRD